MMYAVKNWYHFFSAWLGSILYKDPSMTLPVIGITGTKGKSTCVELLAAVLEAGGHKVAMISSVHIKIGRSMERNLTGRSMPGRFFLQKFLSQAKRAGCTVAVIEVTSQGISQHRHRFIHFDAGGFTGLHPEHIEAHGSFENYKNAKKRFFFDAGHDSVKRDKRFFVNADSPYAHEFEEATGGAQTVYYSRDKLITERLGGDKKKIGGWFESDFNLENAALVSEIALWFGVSWDSIFDSLKSFRGVPGRLEMIATEGKKKFWVVVDYAHTPDSLAALYRFIKSKLAEKSAGGRMICVLGSAGGGRDRWKRPEMGRIADMYCDEVILTDEDPYDEDPLVIMKEIATGMSVKPYRIIADRKQAIKRALEVAETRDAVVITGKGSEMWLNMANGVKLPWSDRKTVEECLKELAVQ